ncbi:MAG: ATP synthase subunit I [Gammaproteobacteria bacterium]|jgi:ATP synthase protein I|nr:ATP synthase subunit I [Gammaproteobacteria bacterium]
MVGLPSKAIRTVLRWQMLATVVLAGMAGWLAGPDGAVSAVLGGSVSIVAGMGFAGMASLSRADSGATLMAGALRAEAVKIILIVLLLWLVLTTYEKVVVVAFFATFFVATVLFSAAALVRETERDTGSGNREIRLKSDER